MEISGHVGSADERSRVFADAWTAGVDDVDVCRLRVLPSLENPMFRDDPRLAPTA